jgi:vacuolar-type H+-ATPase subunit E/Vma4
MTLKEFQDKKLEEFHNLPWTEMTTEEFILNLIQEAVELGQESEAVAHTKEDMNAYVEGIRRAKKVIFESQAPNQSLEMSAIIVVVGTILDAEVAKLKV